MADLFSSDAAFDYSQKTIRIKLPDLHFEGDLFILIATTDPLIRQSLLQAVSEVCFLGGIALWVHHNINVELVINRSSDQYDKYLGSTLLDNCFISFKVIQYFFYNQQNF